MPQEECFHSQQELRTILFEEREYDVYFQGDHIHSFNPTSWEASSIQTHAWRYSFWPLWFELHDKRQVMELYLAKNDLYQSNSALGTSLGNKLVFVCLLVQDPLGVIDCNLPYL